MPRRADALVAALLLTPIGGYLLLGRWRRALAFTALEALLVLIAVASVLRSSALATAATVFLAVVLLLAGIGDAVRLAGQSLGRPRRWGLALTGALAILLLSGAYQPVRANLVESFSGSIGTMLPTLAPGDHFWVDKRPAALRRGDVVAFRFPPAPAPEQVLRVKRVLALAGDTVEMRDGNLLVNGTPVASRPIGEVTSGAAGVYVRPAGDRYQEWEETLEARRYRTLRIPGAPGSSFEPVRVPPGHFFMLGDNRDNNRDSRRYDAIQVDSVVGRALWIWWSRSPEGRVRWERLGQRL